LPDEDTSAFAESQIDDRVWMINPVGESARVWVLHQAASRQLRKDMALALKKSVKELDSIDNEEFMAAVEAHAVDVEKNFIKMFSSEATHEFDEIRARFFPSAAPLPTFDFEIN
jgi:predicted solute-binding protein